MGIEIQKRKKINSQASKIRSRGWAAVVSTAAAELRVGMGMMWAEMKEMQRVQSVERGETARECTGSKEEGR